MRTNKGILKGLALAIVTVVLIVLAFLALSTLFVMPKAHAADWPFPEPPYVFVMFDYEKNETFCPKEDSSIVGHPGFGQVLKQSKSRRWELALEYTHNSCAFARDLNSYDALGIRAQWSPWR